MLINIYLRPELYDNVFEPEKGIRWTLLARIIAGIFCGILFVALRKS